MQSKKFLIVAQFELKEIIRKPSFWLTTLFLPLLIGAISFISGYASIEASKSFENIGDQFKQIYIVDKANVIQKSFLSTPFESADSYDNTLSEVKNDPSKLLIYIPQDFSTNFKYEIIYKSNEKLLSGVTMAPVINNLIKQSAITQISNPLDAKILTTDPSSEIKTFDKNGNLISEGIGQYILPIISLVVFFLAVFISSSFLLQSVSAEKENRMIETMLSIVDKKSLMFGKMLGLTVVVLLQLILWVGLGAAVYILGQNYFHLSIPIDFNQIDFSLLPVNIFLTLSGFIFFAAIMTGVGAVGTGAQDSKNLSSIFIMLSIFPLYLMQILITDPAGKLATIFTYFPFTSHMILLVRNSLGAISTQELILGILITTIYDLLAIWLALKLFELGCLMYNRRPSFREILGYIKRRKNIA